MSNPFTLPGLEIQWISGGRLWLDGGAMFGVVPKPLWERKAPADAKNRVQFETNCLLVKVIAANKLILVDTGCGANVSERERLHMTLDEGHPLLRNLAAAGVRPEQIDLVVLTHLHFDHAGGCTVGTEQGKLRPAFPNARYVVQRAEWEDASSDLPELAGNYPPANFMPLGEQRVLELVDGDVEILPGLRVRYTGGHSRGHQAVVLGNDAEGAIYIGDICPTSAHLATFWTMSYDQNLRETRQIKATLLREAADRGWAVLFDHDVNMCGAYVQRDTKEGVVMCAPIEVPITRQ